MEQDSVDHIDYLDPHDCIARIKKCNDLIRKVCLCKSGCPSETITEALREARYEILNVILHMRQVENKVGVLKTKDEIEREIFHAEYETAVCEKKMENIREEWRISQKTLAELQDSFYYKTHLLGVYSSHLATQGSALAGLFAKILAQGDNVIPVIMENEDMGHALDVMTDYLCSFVKLAQIDMPRTDSCEYKYALAICDALVNMTVHEKGRLLLLEEKRAIVLFVRIVEFIPHIPISKGDTIKICMLKVVQNICMVNDGCHFLQNVKTITQLFDNLRDNCKYFVRIVINIFLMLSKYVNQDSEPFFANLKETINRENSYLSNTSDEKIKHHMEKITGYIGKAERYFVTLKELRALSEERPMKRGRCKRKHKEYVESVGVQKRDSSPNTDRSCKSSKPQISDRQIEIKGRHSKSEKPLPYKEFAKMAELSRKNAKKMAEIAECTFEPASLHESEISEDEFETPECSCRSKISSTSISEISIATTKPSGQKSKVTPKESSYTDINSFSTATTKESSAKIKGSAKTTCVTNISDLGETKSQLLAKVTLSLSKGKIGEGKKVKSKCSFKIPKAKLKKDVEIRKMLKIIKRVNGKLLKKLKSGKDDLEAAESEISCVCGEEVKTEESPTNIVSEGSSRNVETSSSALDTSTPSKKGWFVETIAYPCKPCMKDAFEPPEPQSTPLVSTAKAETVERANSAIVFDDQPAKASSKVELPKAADSSKEVKATDSCKAVKSIGSCKDVKATDSSKEVKNIVSARQFSVTSEIEEVDQSRRRSSKTVSIAEPEVGLDNICKVRNMRLHASEPALQAPKKSCLANKGKSLSNLQENSSTDLGSNATFCSKPGSISQTSSLKTDSQKPQSDMPKYNPEISKGSSEPTAPQEKVSIVYTCLSNPTVTKKYNLVLTEAEVLLDANECSFLYTKEFTESGQDICSCYTDSNQNDSKADQSKDAEDVKKTSQTCPCNEKSVLNFTGEICTCLYKAEGLNSQETTDSLLANPSEEEHRICVCNDAENKPDSTEEPTFICDDVGKKSEVLEELNPCVCDVNKPDANEEQPKPCTCNDDLNKLESDEEPEPCTCNDEEEKLEVDEEVKPCTCNDEAKESEATDEPKPSASNVEVEEEIKPCVCNDLAKKSEAEEEPEPCICKDVVEKLEADEELKPCTCNDVVKPSDSDEEPMPCICNDVIEPSEPVEEPKPCTCIDVVDNLASDEEPKPCTCTDVVKPSDSDEEPKPCICNESKPLVPSKRRESKIPKKSNIPTTKSPNLIAQNKTSSNLLRTSSSKIPISPRFSNKNFSRSGLNSSVSLIDQKSSVQLNAPPIECKCDKSPSFLARSMSKLKMSSTESKVKSGIPQITARHSRTGPRVKSEIPTNIPKEAKVAAENEKDESTFAQTVVMKGAQKSVEKKKEPSSISITDGTKETEQKPLLMAKVKNLAAFRTPSAATGLAVHQKVKSTFKNPARNPNAPPPKVSAQTKRNTK